MLSGPIARRISLISTGRCVSLWCICWCCMVLLYPSRLVPWLLRLESLIAKRPCCRLLGDVLEWIWRSRVLMVVIGGSHGYGVLGIAIRSLLPGLRYRARACCVVSRRCTQT